MKLNYAYEKVRSAYAPRGYMPDLPGERFVNAMLAILALIAEFVTLILTPAISVVSRAYAWIMKVATPILRKIAPPVSWAFAKLTFVLNLVFGLFAKLTNHELRAFASTYANMCLQMGQIELHGYKAKYFVQISRVVKVATLLLFAGAIAKSWTAESTTMLGILSFTAVSWTLLKANYLWANRMSLAKSVEYILYAPTIRTTLFAAAGTPYYEASEAGAHSAGEAHSNGSFPELFIGAIGYIFGDIGTSPLYVMRAALKHHEVSEFSVYGVLSMIFWTMFFSVTVKYVFVMLQANFNGEGGTPAQLRLLDKKKVSKFFFFAGVFAIGLLIGDAFITPAISVSSAVEGLTEINPGLEPYVIYIVSLLIFGLFFVQHKGTATISKIVGPVMFVWFLMIGGFGAAALDKHPGILAAASPVYALDFGLEVLMTEGWLSFSELLGAIVLCATGGEAIYADLVHFSKKSIRAAWCFVAMPALLLNYFGQGAALLANPELKANPFYGVYPEEFVPVAVFMATCATLIASQALIGGTFSLTKQLVERGNLPNSIKICLPNKQKVGQIYVPLMNKVQYAGVMVTIFIFGKSSNMEGAYGLAVCGTMLITTMLLMMLIAKSTSMSVAFAFGILSPFFLFDGLFFAANMSKLGHGGAYPLAIGLIVGGMLWLLYKPGQAYKAKVVMH